MTEREETERKERTDCVFCSTAFFFPRLLFREKQRGLVQSDARLHMRPTGFFITKGKGEFPTLGVHK